MLPTRPHSLPLVDLARCRCRRFFHPVILLDRFCGLFEFCHYSRFAHIGVRILGRGNSTRSIRIRLLKIQYYIAATNLNLSVPLPLKCIVTTFLPFPFLSGILTSINFFAIVGKSWSSSLDKVKDYLQRYSERAKILQKKLTYLIPTIIFSLFFFLFSGSFSRVFAPLNRILVRFVTFFQRDNKYLNVKYL